jgi:hypothetical protein
MWPLSVRKRKGQPFDWLVSLVGLICTIAMIVGYAFADRLAALLPQSMWFWIAVGLATLAAAFRVGWNGPDVRWIRRQCSKLRTARKR